MTEHPLSGSDERLHLERFLHTSAQYFGLTGNRDAGPVQTPVCRKPPVPGDMHLPRYGAKQVPNRR